MEGNVGGTKIGLTHPTLFPSQGKHPARMASRFQDAAAQPNILVYSAVPTCWGRF